MKYKGEELKLEYESPPNGNGSILCLWSGPSLKHYPSDIKNKDKVFYISIDTSKPYRFRLEDQEELLEAVLSIVVRPEARRIKAKRFLEIAKKYNY